MNILGLYNAHNATAAILTDGKIIACVSEERFTKVKNQYGFPKHAIDYCLRCAGIKSSDLDLVVIPFKYGAPQHSLRENNPDLKLSLAISVYKVAHIVRNVWGELAYRYPDLMPIGKFFFRSASIAFEKIHMSSERQFVADFLNIHKSKVVTIDHHLTHAISGYYCSPFNGEKTLVMTLDGEGDFKCATVSVFEKGKYKLLASSDREHSLGYVYQRLTHVMGMKTNEHEYKVMGLAPYAKDTETINKVYQKIKDIVYLDPQNPLVFKSKFNTIDTDKFIRRELSRVRFDILAAVFQKLVEDKTTEWVRYAIKKTKINRVVLSGGVFMNVKANQKIAELPEVKELFVMPSCGDESTPIGAALWGEMNFGNENNLKNAIIDNLYLGPEFTNDDVENVIKKLQLKRKYIVTLERDIEKKIAQLLAKGKIVARMNGRMEFGARALGNRSILANPTDPWVIRKINDQIKGRDFWMPFAPVILWERMNDYLVNPKNIKSPYMMLGFETKELAKKDLLGALHPYDFTARPQLLAKEANPKYYKILKEYEKLTKRGGILNTSFNLHGYPIVLGPSEAVETFENSGLGYLALEDYLISKHNA
jgi:carbamoyltransferase